MQATTLSDDLKQCSKCKEWKTRDLFRNDRTRGDGKFSYCKACDKERERLYREQNVEMLRQKSLTYSATHAEEIKARSVHWRANNRERHRRSVREWASQHPEQAQIAHGRWEKANIDKVRDFKRTHRAKRRASQEPASVRAGDFTTTQWRALCTWFQQRCLACGRKRALTVDHVLPLRDGGTNSIHNIQPLCRHCNNVKARKSIDYRDPVQLAAFLKSIGSEADQ